MTSPIFWLVVAALATLGTLALTAGRRVERRQRDRYWLRQLAKRDYVWEGIAAAHPGVPVVEELLPTPELQACYDAAMDELRDGAM